MAGRGGVTQSSNGIKVFDGIGPDPDPRVLCFNAADRWVQAKEPMHADIDTTKVNGVGPGLIFAKELLSLQHSTGDEIGLVPCAIGATSMDEWLPGTVLYKQMVDRALKSVETYPNSDGKIVRLRGLLWYQGESDTNSTEAVEKFPSKLKTFFTTFWNQIGAPQDFIIQQVQVTCRIMVATEYVEQLRHAQLDVGAAMQHPRVWTVDANGLAIKDDGVHLTRDSQYILGTALAKQHIAIIAGSASPANPWKCVPDAR
ncbi:g4152 [Coccomyxa elongata]